MRRERIAQREAARRLGLTTTRFHRLLTGRARFIDPAIACAIERETGGQVTAADFITFMSQREAA